MKNIRKTQHIQTQHYFPHIIPIITFPTLLVTVLGCMQCVPCTNTLSCLSNKTALSDGNIICIPLPAITQVNLDVCTGAHTIGRSHCTSFSNRLYNFNSTMSQDPSLDPNYTAQLKQQCPQGSTDPNLVVPMDPNTPNSMDTSYYQNIRLNRGLFTSDQTLLTHAATLNQVSENAANPFVWRENFAAAMVKMGQMSVLTGSVGEIRLNCRVINWFGWVLFCRLQNFYGYSTSNTKRNQWIILVFRSRSQGYLWNSV